MPRLTQDQISKWIDEIQKKPAILAGTVQLIQNEKIRPGVVTVQGLFTTGAQFVFTIPLDHSQNGVVLEVNIEGLGRESAPYTAGMRLIKAFSPIEVGNLESNTIVIYAENDTVKCVVKTENSTETIDLKTRLSESTSSLFQQLIACVKSEDHEVVIPEFLADYVFLLLGPGYTQAKKLESLPHLFEHIVAPLSNELASLMGGVGASNAHTYNTKMNFELGISANVDYKKYFGLFFSGLARLYAGATVVGDERLQLLSEFERQMREEFAVVDGEYQGGLRGNPRFRNDKIFRQQLTLPGGDHQQNLKFLDENLTPDAIGQFLHNLSTAKIEVSAASPNLEQLELVLEEMARAFPAVVQAKNDIYGYQIFADKPDFMWPGPIFVYPASNDKAIKLSRLAPGKEASIEWIVSDEKDAEEKDEPDRTIVLSSQKLASVREYIRQVTQWDTKVHTEGKDILHREVMPHLVSVYPERQYLLESARLNYIGNKQASAENPSPEIIFTFDISAIKIDPNNFDPIAINLFIRYCNEDNLDSLSNHLTKDLVQRVRIVRTYEGYGRSALIIMVTANSIESAAIQEIIGRIKGFFRKIAEDGISPQLMAAYLADDVVDQNNFVEKDLGEMVGQEYYRERGKNYPFSYFYDHPNLANIFANHVRAIAGYLSAETTLAQVTIDAPSAKLDGLLEQNLTQYEETEYQFGTVQLPLAFFAGLIKPDSLMGFVGRYGLPAVPAISVPRLISPLLTVPFREEENVLIVQYPRPDDYKAGAVITLPIPVKHRLDLDFFHFSRLLINLYDPRSTMSGKILDLLKEVRLSGFGIRLSYRIDCLELSVFGRPDNNFIQLVSDVLESLFSLDKYVTEAEFEAGRQKYLKQLPNSYGPRQTLQNDVDLLFDPLSHPLDEKLHRIKEFTYGKFIEFLKQLRQVITVGFVGHLSLAADDNSFISDLKQAIKRYFNPSPAITVEPSLLSRVEVRKNSALLKYQLANEIRLVFSLPAVDLQPMDARTQVRRDLFYFFLHNLLRSFMTQVRARYGYYYHDVAEYRAPDLYKSNQLKFFLVQIIPHEARALETLTWLLREFVIELIQFCERLITPSVSDNAETESNPVQDLLKEEAHALKHQWPDLPSLWREASRPAEHLSREKKLEILSEIKDSEVLDLVREIFSRLPVMALVYTEKNKENEESERIRALLTTFGYTLCFDVDSVKEQIHYQRLSI